MKVRHDFARKFESARKKARVSMREVGKRAGTSASYVHSVVHEKLCPTLDAAERLAEAIGSSLPDLLQSKPSGK